MVESNLMRFAYCSLAYRLFHIFWLSLWEQKNIDSQSTYMATFDTSNVPFQVTTILSKSRKKW